METSDSSEAQKVKTTAQITATQTKRQKEFFMAVASVSSTVKLYKSKDRSLCFSYKGVQTIVVNRHKQMSSETHNLCCKRYTNYCLKVIL